MPINDTPRYVNQYYDVTDLPETAKDERKRTCNVSCVAMITDQDVNEVLQDFFERYGKGDEFQYEENLVKYLEENGYDCNRITKPAWPRARVPMKSELEEMKLYLDKGAVILYHKDGHYQIMIGYESGGYIFNDPAGDRKQAQKDRSRESGHCVLYPASMIESERIYGSCYGVII